LRFNPRVSFSLQALSYGLALLGAAVLFLDDEHGGLFRAVQHLTQPAKQGTEVRRLLAVCRAVLISIGSLWLVATVTPLTSWWANKLAGRWEDPRGEILIVLGAEIIDSDGMIGESSYWRAVYAVRAWREGGFQEMILVGGPPGKWPVAEAMRQFVVAQGVPERETIIEPNSRSTRENALYAQRLLGDRPGRKVLLTSDFHMFRAFRAFRKVGLDVEPRHAVDILKRARRWQNRWPLLVDLGVETVKIGYYRMRGWI